MPYIVFQWQDNSKIEDGHRVYRSSEPMNPNALPSPVATLGANVEEFVDETFTDESPLAEMLYYRVSSYKGSQNLVSEELSLPNPANVLSPDSPTWLFGDGESGYANTLGIDTLFTDTAGTTPVEAYGDAIALATNLADDGPDMEQATGAERLVWGRAPVVGGVISVRNLFPARSDDRPWTNGGQYGSGANGTITTGEGFDTLVRTSGAWGRSFHEQDAALPVGTYITLTMDVRWSAGSGAIVRMGGSAAVGLSDVEVEIPSASSEWQPLRVTVVTTSTENQRLILSLMENGTSVDARNVQVEYSAEPTAYQSVGAGPYDVTESGTPSVNIAYSDTSDDNWSWSLAAGTYHVFIAGEKGCYFDTVTHAGGEFTVGPTTWTGGPSGAITALIGQRHVLLPVILDRAFDDFERAQLVAYAMAKGCPGVWEAGTEMFRDPSFDDAGVWTGSGIISGEMVVSGGVLTITNLSGASGAVDNGISPQIASGNLYLGEFTIDSTDGGNLRFQAGGYTGTNRTTTGLKREIIVATSASAYLGLQGITVGLDAVVSSISAKQLTLNTNP